MSNILSYIKLLTSNNFTNNKLQISMKNTKTPPKKKTINKLNLKYIVAVYGSLKKGKFNDFNKIFPNKTKFLGKDTIIGQLYQKNNISYPFLGKGNNKVNVELYELSLDHLGIHTSWTNQRTGI